VRSPVERPDAPQGGGGIVPNGIDMKQRMWRVALAVAIGILLASAGAASARPAGPVIGVGDQHPQMFGSRPWQRLGLHDARYVAPWDVLHDPSQLSLLDGWMAAARRDHIRVVISFAHSLRTEKLAHTLPTQRQFERAFKAVRARFPWVRDWIPWNEANNPGALTAHRPGRAGQYFDAVARNCRGCRVVAADLLDTSNMGPWAAKFRRAVHHKPRIWGMHNYGDANRFRVKNTERLLARTRGQIWFTETGGVVLRRQYKGHKVLRTYRYGTRHAARAMAQVFRLACLSPRITRIYLYNWQAPRKVTSWDSGLLSGRGRLRPAYTVLRRWIARSDHTGRRALCRGM
jgi:hypothetical protein